MKQEAQIILPVHDPEYPFGNDAYIQIPYDRRSHLESIFHEVFIAAIQSGLLIEKAMAKAVEAINNYDEIELARDRAIDAKMNGTAVDQS